MENYTHLFCDDFPWQANAPCITVDFEDQMLAATQGSGIIHQKPTKKLTEEAVYMICVILAFVGLSAIGTSITAYEFFFKDNEKKSELRRNGYKESIAESSLKVSKESKSSANYDFLTDWKSLVKCFCIVKNGGKILSTTPPKGFIGCFQGLRAISCTLIIWTHFGLAYIRSLRRVEDMKPLLELRLTQIAVNGTFTVDVFFVLSGFLNAKAFLQKYRRSNGNISWFFFYFKRFVRLTPVYMIVLGFQATLFSYTGSGTLWPTYDTNPLCQKDWWWHLLYISNFENAYKQCMTWCWYLATDMQLYIISPLFLVPLIRWPRFGYALILACIFGSVASSFLLTYHYNLIDGFSRFEFHLDDAKNFTIKFWKYVDVAYSKPYVRLSSYLVAILLAYYMNTNSFKKGTARNNTVTLCCGWIVTAIFMWCYFFSLYKREELLITAAMYNGIRHFFFSCGLIWMIYLCLTGQSEFLNKYLSWKYFLPLSRLSYCAYLIHPIIIVKYFLEAQNFTDFSYIGAISLALYFTCLTFAVSFLVSVLFEMPVLNLMDWFSEKQEKKPHTAHLD